MIKIKDLRGLTVDELRDKLAGFKKNLFDLNFQRRYGKVEKPHLFRHAKRDIARILTVLREKKDAK